MKKSVELAPTDARFGYVLAAALAGNGARDDAIRVLEATLEHRPNDANALQALSGYLRAAGRTDRAAEVQRRLDVVLRE